LLDLIITNGGWVRWFNVLHFGMAGFRDFCFWCNQLCYNTTLLQRRDHLSVRASAGLRYWLKTNDHKITHTISDQEIVCMTLLLQRDAMHTRDLCRRVVSVLCASVYLSVRPSRSCIFSKRINLGGLS